MNYYANFVNLYTELDFFYMRMLLDRSAYCLNFAFRPAFKCVYVQLKCVYYIFFIVFAFLQSYYKTGTKKERKKKKKRFIVHILNSDIFSKKKIVINFYI